MKKQARLAAMGRARNRVRKFELAADAYPGTEFDRMIKEMLDALRWCGSGPTRAFPINTTPREMGEWQLMQWGYTFATEIKRAIERPNPKTAIQSMFFHNLAKALDTWRTHNPRPNDSDYLRQALIQIQLSHGDGPYEMRDILAYLRDLRFPIDDDTRRQVYREAPRLGLKIQGLSGNPTNRDKTRIKNRETVPIHKAK